MLFGFRVIRVKAFSVRRFENRTWQGGLKPLSANLSLFRHVDVDLDLDVDVDVDVLLRNPFSRAS
jgi:hypothetical protein